MARLVRHFHDPANSRRNYVLVPLSHAPIYRWNWPDNVTTTFPSRGIVEKSRWRKEEEKKISTSSSTFGEKMGNASIEFETRGQYNERDIRLWKSTISRLKRDFSSRPSVHPSIHPSSEREVINLWLKRETRGQNGALELVISLGYPL